MRLHPGVPCVAFCTGCSGRWRAWLCARDARRTLRSLCFATHSQSCAGRTTGQRSPTRTGPCSARSRRPCPDGSELLGAGNSAVVVDVPRCGPMLSPRVPNLVPIPGPRMERETPSQRPRPNYGHPQAKDATHEVPGRSAQLLASAHDRIVGTHTQRQPVPGPPAPRPSLRSRRPSRRLEYLM